MLTYLSSEVSAPYHLPLPRHARRDDGDYALTNDGRFYSKMDFPRRPKHFRTLRTEIIIRAVDSGFDLDFSIEESEAPFTIELCFRKDRAACQPKGLGWRYEAHLRGLGMCNINLTTTEMSR